MKKLVQIIFACCLILCVSCEKEERSPLEQIQAGAPVVTDQAASVTENTVVLYGYVNPQYLLIGGECGFIISISPSPSLDNGRKFAAHEIDKNGRYSVALEGLSSSTKYYFRAYVNTGVSYLEGETKGFTTKSVRARVTTASASDVSVTSAMLNGSLSVEGEEKLSKSVSFLYSTSEKTLEGLKSNGERESASLEENGSFSRTIEFLSLNTTYYYVACAKVHDKEFYGEVRSFSTTNAGVTLTTKAATEIGLFEATLNGNLVVKDGEQLSKTVWFLYSDSAKTLEDLKYSGKRVSSYLSEDGSFTKALSSLDDNTTYYYVACAKVHDNEFYGDVKSVTTKKLQLPSGAVDMGLSVKWRSTNLGATNPEEYGGYYQWAGTRDVSDTNIYLDLDNCPYHTGSSFIRGWIKYNTESSYGTVDNKTTLEPSDDAATVKLGGKWRMPTDAEWTELSNNCTWAWTTLNGVAGYVVTSNKNGNSIFLPAAGYRSADCLRSVGFDGCYWSSSLNTDDPLDAYDVYFDKNGERLGNSSRYFGNSVRPVTK